MKGFPNSQFFSRKYGKEPPRLSLVELEVQIALGTLPAEYITTQVHDPDILDRLAKLHDADVAVREAIVRHKNVRLATLKALMDDSMTPVGLLVLIAAHPKITIELLQEIAKHKNPIVSEEAKGVLFIKSKGHIDIQDD